MKKFQAIARQMNINMNEQPFFTQGYFSKGDSITVVASV